MNFPEKGEAFQVGVGAHLNDPTVYGASGWLYFNVLSQPASGPTLNDNNASGDFNFELPNGPGLLDVPSCLTICAGESVASFASGFGGGGGFTFEWATGETTASISVSPIVNTTYSVTVLDANGCSDTAEVEVIVNDGSEIVCSSQDGQCSGLGSASVTVLSGNGPYTFAWSNGETSASIFGLADGTYSVVVLYD